MLGWDGLGWVGFGSAAVRHCVAATCPLYRTVNSLETLSPLGHRLADPPAADDGEGLPLQLQPHELLPLPLAVLHRDVRLCDSPAAHREDDGKDNVNDDDDGDEALFPFMIFFRSTHSHLRQIRHIR